jgi:bifunctional non-homologous end joining protein LigD
MTVFVRWQGRIDAELVVPTPERRSDFEELRRRALLQRSRLIEQAAALRPAVLVVFDLLELDGEDLRPLPLLDRRDPVHWFGSPVPGIQAIQYVETHGEALFSEIVRHGQEGLVAKRLDLLYRAGRQSSWLKIKNKSYSRRGAVEWQGR